MERRARFSKATHERPRAFRAPDCRGLVDEERDREEGQESREERDDQDVPRLDTACEEGDRHERADHRAERVACALHAERLAGCGGRRGLRHEDIAWRRPAAACDPRGHAAGKDLRPTRAQGNRGDANGRDEIADRSQRLPPSHPIGHDPAPELGERGQAIGTTFDPAQRGRSRSERQEHGG